MKRMRKCNDEIYQLGKDQALVKKLKKNKRFRPLCLCPPDVMFVTRGYNVSIMPSITCNRAGNVSINIKLLS